MFGLVLATRSRIERFAASLTRPLEWSLVDRTLILAALPMLAYAVGTSLLAGDLRMGPPISEASQHLLSTAFEWGLGVVAGYAVIIALGVLLRHRRPASRAFVHLTLVYFSINTAIIGSFVRPFASAIWLSALGLAMLALLLLDHTDVFVAVGLFLVTLAVGAGRTLLDASRQPLNESTPDLVPSAWLTSRMAVFTVINAIVIVLLTALVISGWRAREARIRRLSNHDDLTGLANRRHLGTMLQAEFERARRYGRDLSCAIVDLDHFKQINDLHGHQVGDRVLESVARLVASSVRSSDTIARYGGDEFMIVLPETSSDGARELAERCRGAIAATAITAGPHTLRTTASVGIASLGHAEVRTVDDLIRITDDALYEAKEQGRDRTVVAS
jgi:diguanylate cyclase (GGDEF)-like protein